MASPKIDGVIEAVRYASNGKIEMVRAYERRGATFSDRVLINRENLVKKLQEGKRFVTGERKILLAGSFETGKPVKALGSDEKVVVTTAGQAGHDLLEEVPVF